VVRRSGAAGREVTQRPASGSSIALPDAVLLLRRCAALLADTVLVVHTLFVAFVVIGFVLDLDRPLPRLALDRERPLPRAAPRRHHTRRHRRCDRHDLPAHHLGSRAARRIGIERSFVARLLHAVVFHDFPEWVFSIAYVAFAIVTALTIRLVPVRPNR
jgi:hypothetical protein